MFKVLLLLPLMSFLLLPQEKIRIFLVGDSTMADKEVKAYPETGWGMPFAAFFNESVTVDNRAKNGRSTRSFIAEQRWQSIMDQLNEGDYVLIQFGHNDEVPTKTTYTPEDQFAANLVRFIAESKSKKAIPILITPVARRKFDASGHIEETHAIYAAIVRKVAEQQQVPLIDLDKESQQLLQQFGPDNSKLLFNYLAPGENPNYPDGRQDDTHFSELGARRMAELVLNDIRQLHISLAERIVTGTNKSNIPQIDPKPFADNAGHWYAIFDSKNIINALPGRPKYQPTELTNIGDNILLFQKKNGGWPKNYDIFAILTDAQKDSVAAARDILNTTYDNGSTYTQISALATVYAATGIEKYKLGAIKGLDFILASQYSNGGWPQYYPLESGYSRCITYNDDVFEGIMRLLKDIKDQVPQYAFVGDDKRRQLAAAYEKGMDCILRTQINDAGKPTAWCQQYDEVSLRPAWARKFEPPSICNRESAGIVLFLMSIDHPKKEIIEAINNAVAWFRESTILNTRVQTIPAPRMVTPFRISVSDRVVVTDPAAPPIWTRYYELKTHRPIFCNRDSKIVYSLAEVLRERRDGYGWYTYDPQQVLNAYPEWQKKWSGIDRNAVVSRHNVVVSSVDTFSSLTVGNGRFAFTVDATGLQSFPEYYAGGIPLGTESDWGWHEFPNKAGYQYSETLKEYNFNGDDKALYAVQWKSGRNQQAADYFRENPHRLQLGNFGLEMTKKDGSPVTPADLQNIHQQLDCWTGVISSSFTIDGYPVKVLTCSDAGRDIIAIKITSVLLAQQRIKIRFRFPYPTNEFADKAVNYTHSADHRTTLHQPSPSEAIFTRQLDATSYFVTAAWAGKATLGKTAAHDYALLPSADTSFEMTVRFSAEPPSKPPAGKPLSKLLSGVPSFASVRAGSIAGWKKFWLSGAAVDFSACTDPRARELERRVVLSQYLTRVQCAGNNPPQETGLTYNSWYGRPHMEMYWWHTAHFALWGRTECMEKSMQWYFAAFNGARVIAQRQGYKGVRWQKMTDDKGGESPSNVGSFLLWQQPHMIYQAELIYRNHPSKETLRKYKKLVVATADFMASFARYDPSKQRYNLGKGFIPAQECHNAAETYNAPYELAYWKWALQTAQKWRSRLGLPPDHNWQKVIDGLAPLPQKDGVYQAAEDVEDSYSPESKYTIDHPAVLAALSTLPANGVVDTAVMHRTYDLVEKSWHWDHTWGWDFPMVAMTAARLHQPAAAINDLFKDVVTNTFLPNGHNYQSRRLTLYLPGNGGLLSAIALFCAGYDGNTIDNPGFPANGQWKVRWEGLQPLP